MKRTLFVLLCLFGSIMAFTQVTNVKYFLKYDTLNCRWDGYVKIISGSGTNLAQFNAQFSVVVPVGTMVSVAQSYNPIRASGAPTDWQVSTSRIGPEVTPNLSYYSITPVLSPTGFHASVVEGQEIRLFGLNVSPAPINCGENIRLWNNNVILGVAVSGDPSSSAAGMSGGNFNNGFSIGNTLQRYSGNLSSVLPIEPQRNTIVSCSAGLEIDLNARVPQCQRPLTYSWTGPNGYASTTEDVILPNANSTASGDYTVITTDALGCKDTVVIRAEAKPRAGGDISGCAGSVPELNGSNPTTGTWVSGSPLITVSPTAGGNATITSIDPAASGSYDIIYVTQSQLCSDTLKLLLGGADAGPDIAPIQCNLNGIANLNAVGSGVWSLAAGSSGTANFSDINSPTSTLSGFSVPGTYRAVWTVGGCSDTLNISVGGDCACPIGSNTATLSSTDLCTIPSNFTIVGGNATPTGGSYQWQVSTNGSSFSDAPNGNNRDYIVPQSIAPGTYTYKRIYTLGPPTSCSGESLPVTFILRATPPIPTVTSPSPLDICVGSTSTITTNPISGAIYTWTANSALAGLGNSTSNTNDISPTMMGVYSVSVTASFGQCTSNPAVITVNANQAPPIPTGATGQNPTQCQGTNGSILITGLTPNINYSVSYSKNGTLVNVNLSANSAGVVTIPNLGAGAYNNFTFAVGTCTSNLNNLINLTDPNAPPAPTNLTAIPNTVCTGQTVNLSATGQTGASFIWTASPSSGSGLGTSTTNTNTMTPTSQGNFIISVAQNVGGCISSAATVQVTVGTGPNTPTASNFVVTSTSECGGSDGRILISGVNPNQNYKITYTFKGNSTTVNLTSDPTGRVELTGLMAGEYTNFIIEDANGCRSGTFAGPIRIADPITNAPEMSVIPNPVCLGDSVVFTALGRSGAVYTWTSPSPAIVIPVGAMTGVIKVLPTEIGTYTVSVTQFADGCVSPIGTVTLVVRNCRNSKIGDFVWNDANANGIQNPGEGGIKDVIVKLIREDDVLIKQTTTDAAGKYQFDDVEPGRYYLKFEGTTLQTTLPNVGMDDNIDSDITNRFGKNTTDIITVVAGEDQMNIDAGFYRCNRIGNLVWYDENRNDVWDNFENGINGLEVVLWRTDGGRRVWARTFTGRKPGSPSDDGWFEFCAPNGTYFIEVILPPRGLVTARPNIGNNRSIDSDITGINGPGTTPSFTINNQDKLDIGAGYYPMATAGNLVWYDENFNGFQEPEEPRLANVKVVAYDAESYEKVGEAITNNEGVYKIDYLKKQEVYFKVIPPSGYSATYQTGSDEYNSDIDHSYGLNTTRSILMNPGAENEDIDFGLALGALPLKWEYITAHSLDDAHHIEWKTSSELNVDYFEVERSIRGNLQFESISPKIKAKNEISKSQVYTYLDKNLLNYGLYTYRIKQVDFDGTTTHSGLAEIDRSPNLNTVEVYPNPVGEELIIDFVNQEEAKVKVEYYTLLGQSMRDYKMETILPSGANKLRSSLQGMASGIYKIKIEVNNKIIWKEIVKQ